MLFGIPLLIPVFGNHKIFILLVCFFLSLVKHVKPGIVSHLRSLDPPRQGLGSLGKFCLVDFLQKVIFSAILMIRIENKLSLRLLCTDGVRRPRSSLSQLWSCLKPEKKIKAPLALNHITIPWWNSFFLFSCWLPQNFYIFSRPSSNQTLSSEYLAYPVQSLCQWLAQVNGKNNFWLIWMDLQFLFE